MLQYRINKTSFSRVIANDSAEILTHLTVIVMPDNEVSTRYYRIEHVEHVSNGSIKVTFNVFQDLTNMKPLHRPLWIIFTEPKASSTHRPFGPILSQKIFQMDR